MDVWLLRHPKVAVSGICYGRSEARLDPTWISKLPQIKKLLPKPIPNIYTSPAPRCQVVAGFLGGAKMTVDERLSEIDFGVWEGRPWADLPEDEVTQWAEDLENAAPHGGETGGQVLERAADFLDALIQQDEDALVVTHAGWIRALLSVLLGTDLDHAFRLDIGFLSLTRIVCNGDMIQISFINQTAPDIPAMSDAAGVDVK